MMISITDSITVLRGISDKRAELYKRMHIETVGDLITHYPRGYVDYTASIPINSVLDNEYAVIRATVTKKMPPYFGKISIYKVVLTDDSGSITCTFFNCDFNYSRLIIGREYIFYGRINTNKFQTELLSPTYIFPDDPIKMTPKYSLTKGLTHQIVTANMKSALESLADYKLDDLPAEIREAHNLLTTAEAIRKIHFPADLTECNHAKRSLVFKELLTLQLGLSAIRSRNRKLTGTQTAPKSIDAFYENLPFKPTNAQVNAVNDCMSDMCKAIPMNRLLQGDVGSGKTAVAAALAYFAHLNGFQTALMAPTEILAKQHFYTFSNFLAPLGIEVTLLVGGMTAPMRKQSLNLIKSGESSVVVGTHALIQKEIDFNSLGLVITDEQHRFGVGQRSELISKGANPHTLVMSATPIPRTLGLIIYGDLDISLLDEMPTGRLEIKTYGVDSTYRERLYKFIKEKVAEGRQAYIVCPLIEESESQAMAPKMSAVKYYESLRNSHFDDIPTGLLHGRMKQSEKDEIMFDFKSGKIKVLISTTVIEVGVDVPNAVVMLIENAEQFGLSQLHQLRGRVGRGQYQSYCVLVTDSQSPYTKARVDTMASTNNGFEIAGKDLELRGPGDFFGSKQHGLPMLRVGDLATDSAILEETQTLAKTLVKDDPELTQSPELQRLVAELFKESNEHGYN